MKDDLAEIVTLSSKASSAEQYDNHALANVNDHVVRISVMTQPYHRHFHPNSDETFSCRRGRQRGETGQLHGSRNTSTLIVDIGCVVFPILRNLPNPG